jgi:hypothetical protein
MNLRLTAGLSALLIVILVAMLYFGTPGAIGPNLGFNQGLPPYPGNIEADRQELNRLQEAYYTAPKGTPESDQAYQAMMKLGQKLQPYRPKP